ncbi:right-handed parallel beta-helix repeat-containing protein [uncultured Parabacteroides sp.]|uniref:right-handed parallel beta-helix repeat-containing protein n=1 Tax=uncultured Parabacteroides sp. TaxID=512312 RepID=UPI0025F14BE1|nr:right-handed parallel beta-helix repeat-containing protein [uncultured Parabacteroides sp.]
MKKIVCFFSVLLFSLLWMSCSNQTASSYYLDAVNGDDSQNGLTEATAWKSLSGLRNVELKPGDRIRLKRGGTFAGELEISGQGTPDNRIYVEAYGEGDKPCIVGNDTSLYAVRIFNSDYLTLRDIAIVNTGKERRPHRTGLKIECRDYGVSRNIAVDGVDVRDVNGSLVKEEGGGSGILIVNGGKDIISVFDSLTIENCHILRCARNAMIWSGYSSRENWHPSKHTIVRNNLIEEVPGDGIVPIGCDSTLIEHNVMRNCPAILPDSEAAAGIWPWSCDNTIIQFNEVSDHKAPWDAQGFDSDWNCRNTLIQYNYSHDNDGGMVLICNSGESPATFNAGNVGTVIRYNISINDGRRTRPTRAGMFSPSIHIAGPVKNTTISHNIIHANRRATKEADRSMITSDSWGGYSDSTFVQGNIFYTQEASTFNFTKSTNDVFSGNYYLGTFKVKPADKDAQSVSEAYQKLIEKDADGFEGLSVLMDTVGIADSEGVFVNENAIRRFFDR